MAKEVEKVDQDTMGFDRVDFRFNAEDANGTEKLEETLGLIAQAIDSVAANTSDSRCKEEALSALEVASLWATKGMTRDTRSNASVDAAADAAAKKTKEDEDETA